MERLVSDQALTLKELIYLLLPSKKGCISLTGGGGKTTFLGVFGSVLKSHGTPVVLTTTTKVQNPFPVPIDWFVAEEDPDRFLEEALARLEPHTLGLAVKGPYGDHKWDGIPPETVGALFDEMNEGIILNEADGAFRLPIKAPDAHEPVIPLSTTVLVPILGLSAFGMPLDETHAFRPHLIAKLTGHPLGQPITEKVIARLFTHPEGITKGVPKGVPIIPFLNQAGSTSLLKVGKRIAEIVLSESQRITSVLIGTLKPEARFEILKGKKD